MKRVTGKITKKDKGILTYWVRVVTTSAEEGWSGVGGTHTHLLSADRVSFLDLYGGYMYAHFKITQYTLLYQCYN